MSEIESEDKYKKLRMLTLALNIPFTMMISPLIGYTLGVIIDKLLATTPWLSVIFLLLGLVAGLLEALKLAKRIK